MGWPPKDYKQPKKVLKEREHARQYAKFLELRENGAKMTEIAAMADMPCVNTLRLWRKNGGPKLTRLGNEYNGNVVMTDDLFALILEKYRDGHNITKILKQDDMPSRGTFYNSLKNNQEYMNSYLEARELHNEAVVDRSRNEAENVLTDEVSPANFSAWFAVQKFVIQRSDATVGQSRNSDGNAVNVDNMSISYVDSDDK